VPAPDEAGHALMPTVRELRRLHGFSQRELAVRARVCLRTVSSAELGRHTTRMDTQRRLLRALGVPFSQRRDVFGELRRRR
jgi:transcriptional regulator with XRE-family HTH domain